MRSPTELLDLVTDEMTLVQCRVGPTLTLRSCLTLRTRVWPSGRAKGRPRFSMCVGCTLGAYYATRCPTFVVPAQTVPTHAMPKAQREARIKFFRERGFNEWDLDAE